MLKVIPRTWSYTFSVTDGTRSVALAVDRSWWRDKAELRIQDDLYTARRDKSAYLLESATGVLARAEQPRKWRRELVIQHSGSLYMLRAKSAFRRDLVLFEGATQIGSISPDGTFTRKAAVELPQEFPLYLQIFVTWLAMTLWRHAEAA
jgi:hypothetical protein